MSTAGPEPSVQLIMDVVAEKQEVLVTDLARTSRHGPAARAKLIVYWLALKLTSLPLTRIARDVRRDHSTVRHGAKALERRLAQDPELAAWVDHIQRAILELAADQPSAPAQTDAMAIARRVVAAAHPECAAMSVSTDEIVAMAQTLTNQQDRHHVK